MREGIIQSVVDEERKRVLALARKISGGLLIFCIEHVYSVEELDTAKQRYAEMPREDAEDLM